MKISISRKRRSGFTIVELVVVIAVIAILASVLVPVFENIAENARFSAALQDARSTLTAFGSDYIIQTSGGRLPEGVVFESRGYRFVYIEGELYKIVRVGEVDCGGFFINYWASPDLDPDSNEVQAGFEAALAAPPSVTIGGVSHGCTDIGYVATGGSGCTFAYFVSDIEEATLTPEGGCAVYAGMILEGPGADVLDSGGEDPAGPAAGGEDSEGGAPSLPTYDVQLNLTGCSSDSVLTCSPGADYILTVTPDEDYEISEPALVTINGIVYEGSSWNAEAGSLTIPKEAIEGDIEIILTASHIKFKFTWNSDCGTVSDADGNAILKEEGGHMVDYLINKNENFTFMFIPNAVCSSFEIRISKIPGNSVMTEGYTVDNRIVTIDGNYIITDIYVEINSN